MEAVDVREVLRKRIPHLRAYLRILTGDEKLADSIALAALERVVQSGAGSDGAKAALELFGHARRECRERVPELAQPPKKGRPLGSLGCPALAHSDCWNGNEFMIELSKLQPEMREPIVLRYGAGFDFNTTFRILGGQEGTFKSRLSRGLRQLSRALEAGGIAADDEELEAA